MIPKEIQDKIDTAALAEHIYEPKYGGKDHSGYDTMMKYEINYEREEAFSNGATFVYNIANEEIERLKGLILSAYTEGLNYGKYEDEYGAKTFEQFTKENNL